MDLNAYLRDVPDFPKPGIVFKDITPLLGSPQAMRHCVAEMAAVAASHRADRIAAIESRGFLFGTPLALHLGLGFTPIRKPGKLPWKTQRIDYALEYGTDALEVHEDAFEAGQRVVLVDDLLATGGTMKAACELVERLGARVVSCLFAVELGFLPGRETLGRRPVHSLLRLD
jgi:adenine phosphoribosyltransferase